MNVANTYTDSVNNITKNELNNNIDKSQKESIAISNSYTDNRFNQVQFQNEARFDSMDKKINDNANKANAGIASVASMANIPYTTNTTFSAGMGVGNYRNGNAIAAGAQYKISDNVNVRTSVSWNNEDSAVVGGGIAVGW
ncbi:YadA-like family protein [Morganella morganii]